MNALARALAEVFGADRVRFQVLLAPLTVVQPCLDSGLVVLLWLGVTRLGERPGKREYIAVAAMKSILPS